MFKVNNKDAIGVVLVSLLLTLNIFIPCSSVSIVNFEHVNADWTNDLRLRKLEIRVLRKYGHLRKVAEMVGFNSEYPAGHP